MEKLATEHFHFVISQFSIAIGDKVLGALRVEVPGAGATPRHAQHPQTQRCQSLYARLLLMTSRAAEALLLGAAALATHERGSGPNNRWTKDSAHVTAAALAALGRAAEAAALRERYGVAADSKRRMG
jgi:hypothetical protein